MTLAEWNVLQIKQNARQIYVATAYAVFNNAVNLWKEKYKNKQENILLIHPMH